MRSSPTSRVWARRSRRSRRSRRTGPSRRSSCARRASSSTGCASWSAGCPGAAPAALSGRGGGGSTPGTADRPSSTTTSSPRGWRSCGGLAPRALVLDESHYCKNAGGQAHAGRAAAGRARCPRDGLVLALTGHAGRQPAGRADLAAADPRPARGVRLRGRSSASASAAPTPTCACTGTCARAASCAG